MKNSSVKGFTLIELLVVISIISLLSSIAFASLSTARARGADAAIRADLLGIKSSAEIEYSNLGNSYNKTGLAVTSNTLSTFSTPNTVFNNQRIKDAVKHIMKINGGKDATGNIVPNGSSYNVTVPLKTPNKSLFLDDTGTITVQ